MKALTRRIHSDERGLVGKIAIVWIVIMALVAVFVLDGISIVTAKYRVADAAGNAASEAAYTYKQTLKIASACARAEEIVHEEDPVARIPLEGCFVNLQDGSVTITVKKLASTILVKRINFLVDLAKASATETAPAPI